MDLDGTLVTQVSRFDPWKDQSGVVEAYRMVKGEVPALKLALVGSMALDDPEGWEPMQMPAGARGFLGGSVEKCAEKLLVLLRNPEEGAGMTREGKEIVEERFLLPRLISEELELHADLLGTHSTPGTRKDVR